MARISSTLTELAGVAPRTVDQRLRSRLVVLLPWIDLVPAKTHIMVAEDILRFDSRQDPAGRRYDQKYRPEEEPGAKEHQEQQAQRPPQATRCHVEACEQQHPQPCAVGHRLAPAGHRIFINGCDLLGVEILTARQAAAAMQGRVYRHVRTPSTTAAFGIVM